MKQAIPLPAVITVVAVVVAVAAIFFVKVAAAPMHTPRPDPAMFGYGPHGAANAAPATH